MSMNHVARRAFASTVLAALAISAVSAEKKDKPTHPGGDSDATVADGAAPGRPATMASPQGPRRIVNQVLDLLDRPVALDSETENDFWESEPFPTSQYNRIGIRADTEVESGSISCSTWWQFTRQDEFRPGLPTTAATVPFIGEDPRPRGEVPDLRPDLFLGAPSNFSDVFGLRAKIVCALAPGDFGQFPPAPSAGTLSDVKVLLRRE